MKILVTGGAGFIGSNFIYYLQRKYDDEILCMDALTYAGNMETLEEASKDSDYSFVKCDIADREAVFKAFEEFLVCIC